MKPAPIMKPTTMAVRSVVLLLSTAGSALAAEPASPYLQIGAGMNFLDHTHFSNPAGTVTSGSHINYDIGPAVTGAIGYAFGNGFRGEFELGYRDSPAKDVTLSGGAVVGGSQTFSAHAEAHSYMFNVLYDFDLGGYGAQYGTWSPHIGGGIGPVMINTHRSPSDTAFGGQAIAGVEYAYSPTVRFGLDYRFIGTTDVHLNYTQAGITSGQSVRTNYYDHAVLFTLRWKFGGPITF
jgi:OmpA-OmpF porin, OOP family